jgi:hypothetical protein
MGRSIHSLAIHCFLLLNHPLICLQEPSRTG